MNNLTIFLKMHPFEKRKRKDVYNEYIIFCEKMHIPKNKRLGKVEAFKEIQKSGYKSHRQSDGEYFVRVN